MGRRRGLRRVCNGIAGIMLLIAALVPHPGAAGHPLGAGRIAVRDGYPTLVVDGRPFFFFGAAFFYERIPAEQWRASMLALHALGVNTLDLYVPWNWHEIGDGEFDFDGHTNGRRNLRGVLALARELGFKLIVRPGPVIRNEWRNGGYPQWLLTRPEYGMPLHDVLEGRYPATATLQNANSDDAAAQWMNNATHIRYATRWLRAALAEFVPYADLVVAVQLDDDQGAYIDNQTWPAPHLQAYLRQLESIVRGVVGAGLPVFINTYEMKVTASAPVWAMGNWYQSDAYSIGEHDRSTLEFSTGLLQTQSRYPVAMSEFQAGWLAPPEDPAPRPADPANTTLALHTLLSLGARGVIDFPAQDTVSPAGWEAPFANAAYVWDAALDVDLVPSARYAPTRGFGDIVRAYGPQLASAHRYADGAIAYLTSAYDETRQTNADVFAIAARTQEAQHACRVRHLTCDLVDLRFEDDALLRRYPFLIVPRAIAQPFTPLASARLARYRAAGGRILPAPPDVITPRAGGIADATILLAADGGAFLDVVNYDSAAHRIARTRLVLPGGRRWDVGPFTVAARDAVLLRFEAGASAPPAPRPIPTAALAPPCAAPPSDTPLPDHPTVTADDRAVDGLGRVRLANGRLSVTLAPTAGGRAFWFGRESDERCSANNGTTSVGALRDDVDVAYPVSVTDKIAKYTRSFPAGMFNRSYHVERAAADDQTASATFAYDAPDVVPNGARFERTVVLRRDESAFTVRERVTFGAGPGADRQRAVRYDSFDSSGTAILDERAGDAIGFFSPGAHTVAIVCWPAADVEDAQLLPERTSSVVRLRFTPGGERRTRYALDAAATVADARMMILKERAALAANR